MRRRPLRRGKDKKVFTQTAKKTKAVSLGNGITPRGGTRF